MLAHQILALVFPEPGLNTAHCSINKSIIQCLIQMQATMERLKSTSPCSPFDMLTVMFGLHQNHHVIIIMLTNNKISKRAYTFLNVATNSSVNGHGRRSWSRLERLHIIHISLQESTNQPKLACNHVHCLVPH